MKKTFTLLALCISFAGFSQSFALYKTNSSAVVTATITNGGFIYEATTANALIDTKLKIKNNAANTQTFNVTRTIVAQTPTLDLSLVPNAQTTYFCFGNNCFTPPVSTPGSGDYTILLGSGQTSTTFPMADNTTDNNQPFSIYLEEGSATGNYVVRYKIFNINNANDTLVFSMAYNQPSGINEQKNSEVQDLKLYPNPAANETSIFVNALNNQEIRLTVSNAIGQLVYNKEYKLTAGANNLGVDCKDLSAGIYMVTIQSGNTAQTKKLVISK